MILFSEYIEKIMRSRLVAHSLFWVVLIILNTFLTSLNSGFFNNHLINNLSVFPSQLAAAYLLNYYQIPKMLLKKKYLLFFCSLGIAIFVFSIIARLSVIYIAEPFINTGFEQETLSEIVEDPIYLLIVYVPTVYIYSLIMLLIKNIKYRFEEKNRMDIILKEKAKTELNFLKTQINPHFLFNTLNNLYTLTLNKSEIAPEIIIKLSKILDYTLYQCSTPKVQIIKEKELIQNYISLEKLRYGNRAKIVFKSEIDNPEKEVAPLLLITFVENAFKHGVSKDTNNSKVDICLKVKQDNLKFEVYNTKPKIKPQVGSIKKGIGSTNIKRQLDLIYNKNHKLIINDETDFYLVNLEINL